MYNQAYEFAQNKITEIGVSIFDTRHCSDAPGANAESWLPKITTRHLIIKEYKKLVNKKFIKGCPDKFNFGTSELVALRNVQTILANIVTNPTAESELSLQPRKVILVGHGLKNDTDYLKSLGFSLAAYTNVTHKMDTQTLAGGSKKTQIGLERLILALGIEPENLHNAGNDAAYTLQALLLIGYQHNADPNALQQAILATPTPVKFKNRNRRKPNAQATAAQGAELGGANAPTNSAGVNLGTTISAPARPTVSDPGARPSEVDIRGAFPRNAATATPANKSTGPVPEAPLPKNQRAKLNKQLRNASGNGSISSPGEASPATNPSNHATKVDKPRKKDKTLEERRQRSFEHHGGSTPAPRLTGAKKNPFKAVANAEQSRRVAGDDATRLSLRPPPPPRKL